MDVPLLKRVCNYAHWIPITQGLHLAFFAEHFPGWEWNDFVPRLLKKKVLELNGEGNASLTKLWHGLYISSDVEAIEFIPTKRGIEIQIIAINATPEHKELEKA
jgi:hypothetical protein